MSSSGPQAAPARALAAAAALYFAMVFGAGFLLGTLRVLVVVPRLGERAAELAEMPRMLAVVWFAATRVVRRFATRLSPRSFALVGAIAALLLLGAELLLAVALAGRGVGEYIAGRDPVSGIAYLVAVAAFAAMPWLVATRESRRTTGWR